MFVARVRRAVTLYRTRRLGLSLRGAWAFAGNLKALRLLETAMNPATPDVVAGMALLVAGIIITKKEHHDQRRQNTLRTDDD